MTYKFRDPFAFRAPAEQVDVDPLYALGTIAQAVGSYGPVDLIYLRAGSAVAEAVGSVLTHGGDYVCALFAANAIGSIAVSVSVKASTTPGLYGWYVKRGNVPTLVLASFADNANCYSSGTPGSIDDTVVAGDYVYKAKSITAIDTPSTGLAVIFFDDSSVNDGLA